MKNTVKSSSEISRLFSQGKRLTTPHITVLIKKDEGEHGPGGRVAFIAGKKNGNAVWRNSAKRRLRAVVAELGGPWPGKTVLFIAKKNILRSNYQVIIEECKRVLAPYI